MGNEISMLNSIRRTTQMGCYGIEVVLDETVNRKFRNALREQHKEYEEIFEEADRLLNERGGKVKDINPFTKYGSAVSSVLRVRASADPTAKIAEMMVQGNTKGMIKSYRARRQCADDAQVRALSEKLLQTELHNVEQMKKFL